MPRDIHITRIIAQTSEVALQLRRLHFSEYRPPGAAWSPAVNAVRYLDRIEICVDLAGVDREDVHVSIEDWCLRIQGVRPAPHAGCQGSAGCRVLMMEIDDGPFERVLPLPRDISINPDQIKASQENGFLWITIPFAS